MKKIFAALLSLMLVSCSFPQLTPTPVLESLTPVADVDPMSIPWEDRSIFERGLVQSQRSILSELPGASVYHLEFNVADDLYHVNGHEEVHYTNTETVPLNEIELRLFPNILGGEMEVSNISIDNQPATPEYDLEDSLLILPFTAPLEVGQSAVVKMDFAVEVPQSVEQNYGVIAYFDEVLALAHAYPMICVYDDEGWNAEIPVQYGDVTYADAAFFIVKVTAPAGLMLVVSGIEVNHSEAGQTQALVAASGPARDFYLAASPNYEELTQQVGEITIRSYATGDIKSGSALALKAAANALEDFGRRYDAEYPYTELDIVATPTLAGGIEYPGLVVAASRLYDLGSNLKGVPEEVIMEAVIAHEVGHQWFYNLVGDDQLDDPWLDESFAQFATLQYFEDEYGRAGAAGFRASLEGNWQSVEGAKIPIGLSVNGYTEEEYVGIVYGRGPLFLVALQKEMGESVFDAFMKDYTAQLSWGIATPDFMQSLAEKHCNCDLDSIFNEWVYR